MPNWVALDPKELSEKSPKHPRVPVEEDRAEGVQIDISMSPYDVPEAVRGYASKDGQTFVIEFRYIEDEPATTRHVSEAVSLKVGDNSGRLYGIVLDLKAAAQEPENLQNVAPQIVGNAVLSFSHQAGRYNREDNYAVAAGVIQDRRHEIFGDLVRR